MHSPRHPTPLPASLFPPGLLHQGSLQPSGVTLKKTSNHKANKRPSRAHRELRGSRGPSPAGLWTTPSQAWLQCREHSPTPHSQQIESGAYTGATGVRARLIVRGLAIRGPAWPHQVQLRVQPLPSAQAQVCQPAPRGLLRPQAQPSAHPTGKGRRLPVHLGRVSFPQKPPGASRRTRL